MHAEIPAGMRSQPQPRVFPPQNSLSVRPFPFCRRSQASRVRIAAAAPIPVTSSTEKLWGQENAAAPNAARNHRKGHNTPHISFKPRIYAVPLT
mgnify:CR=1 FL=1